MNTSLSLYVFSYRYMTRNESASDYLVVVTVRQTTYANIK